MRTRRSSLWSRWIRAALVALVPLAACSGDKEPRKGQIMLAVQTDMSIPDDVSHIRIIVQKNGAIKFDTIYEVGPDKEEIPATLGLIASDDPEDTVEVRVLGYQEGTVRTLSRAVTTIPQERIATLHVPIQWLCWNQVTTTQGIDESVDSSCENPNEACVAGECEDVRIDSDTLPDFRLEDIQGGADEPEQGVCLDTVACFDAGTPAVLGADCTLVVAANAVDRLNVAVTLPANSRGICSSMTDRCYVPLDRDERYGWRVLEGGPDGSGGADGAGGAAEPSDAGSAGSAGATALPPAGGVTIKLPSAVCARIEDGEATGVQVTSLCTTKTSTVPTCGPWTSIGTDNPNLGPQRPGSMMPVPPGSECPQLYTAAPGEPIAEGPEVDRFAKLVLELSASAERVRTDVFQACVNINGAVTGSPVALPGDPPTDEQVEAACDDAVLNVGNVGQYTLAFGDAYCRAETGEQLSLEGECADITDCTPEAFETRCSMPLSTCDGACEGPCVPSGTSLTVACDGFCDGQCDGSCDGACTGPGGNELPSDDCLGQCSGTCLGTCQGECSTTATCAGVCRGTCDGATSNVECEHPLSVAACAQTSVCQNLAAATAGIHQICRAPSVLVTSQTPPNVAPAISQNFPRLLGALEQNQGLSLAMSSLATAGSQLSVDVTSDPQNPDAACIFEALTLFSEASARIGVATTAAVRVLTGATTGTHPACAAVTGDDACASCVKVICCTDLATCSENATCGAETECLRQCVAEGGTREGCSRTCAASGGVLDPDSDRVLSCLVTSCSPSCAAAPPVVCTAVGSGTVLDDFDDNDTIGPFGDWSAIGGAAPTGAVTGPGASGAAGDFGLTASGISPGLTLRLNSCLDFRQTGALTFLAQSSSAMGTDLDVLIHTHATDPATCPGAECGDHFTTQVSAGYMFFANHSIPFQNFANSRFQALDPAEIVAIDFVASAPMSTVLSLDDVSLDMLPIGATGAN